MKNNKIENFASPGNKCSSNKDCGDKSKCLGGRCCHTHIYWNQPKCNSCSSSGWCNGCKNNFEYVKKNGS